MKLQEVFDQLSAGEFSQLSIGGANAGVIDEANYKKVLGHVNLGLTALFTRFNLKERSLEFTLNPASDTYQLNLEDMLKITKLVTDLDVELPVNEGGNKYSCFTPSLNTIRVPQVILDQGPDLPEDLKTEKLKVVYRANHPKIKPVLGVLLPNSVELELPSTHLLPLLYFVASRVHNPIGMSNEFHAGNSYWKKYEVACQELEGKGMQVDRETDNFRLTRNGWM
jgi:hypothetical protein